MTTAHFMRSDRLRRSSDFRLLSKRGKRASGHYFVLLWLSRPLQEEPSSSRIGITVSRKVGKAVVRNRVKRQIREWYRSSRADLCSELDIVVIARPTAAELGTRDTRKVLREMVRRNFLDAAKHPIASLKESR